MQDVKYSFGEMLKSKKLVKVAVIFYLLILVWWSYLYLNSINGYYNFQAVLFTNIYGYMALLGGLFGMRISRYWGGLKSLFGKSIFFISLGLFFQFIGQITYNILFYVIKNGDIDSIPYPSVGDIGFFGSVIFYIIGSVFLLKTFFYGKIGKNIFYKSLSILVPVIILFLTYLFFLREYSFSGMPLINILLDFGYPFGQAIYVSLALYIAFISRNVLGGAMANPTRLFLFGLLFQYACDFVFLFQHITGSWVAAGYNEFMYFTSYFIMTLALGYIGYTYESFKNQVKNITV